MKFIAMLVVCVTFSATAEAGFIGKSGTYYSGNYGGYKQSGMYTPQGQYYGGYYRPSSPRPSHRGGVHTFYGTLQSSGPYVPPRRTWTPVRRFR